MHTQAEDQLLPKSNSLSFAVIWMSQMPPHLLILHPYLTARLCPCLLALELLPSHTPCRPPLHHHATVMLAMQPAPRQPPLAAQPSPGLQQWEAPRQQVGPGTPPAPPPLVLLMDVRLAAPVICLPQTSRRWVLWVGGGEQVSSSVTMSWGTVLAPHRRWQVSG